MGPDHEATGKTEAQTSVAPKTDPELTGKTKAKPSVVTTAEREYRSLVSFFKWIVGFSFLAISFFGAASLFLFYRDIGEVRNEAQSQIQAAAKNADAMLTRIREDAERVASTEARARVEEAFRTQNLAAMIESEAKRALGSTINRLVANQVDAALATVREETDRSLSELRAQAVGIGEIADMAARMRIGGREGLERLHDDATTAADPERRKVTV